jgi:hypothetical protein
MEIKGSSRLGAVLAVVLLGTLATMRGAEAAPMELITNGGFETGTLAGWTVTDQAGGSGTFFASNAAVSPLSGLPTAGPATGAFYAVSDQTGPGAHALSQSFTVPSGGCPVTLTFDMFVNDQSLSGGIIDPAGLDYSVLANQHARVDILTAAAGR